MKKGTNRESNIHKIAGEEIVEGTIIQFAVVQQKRMPTLGHSKESWSIACINVKYSELGTQTFAR